jgi:hypothetical protein
MAIIKGKVQTVSSRETQYGTMYSLKINNEYYSVGKYPPKCAEGDYVKFDATANGKYWNLTKGAKIEKVGAEDVPPPAPAPSGGGSYGRGGFNDDKRQEVISRQAARNTAISFLELAHANGALAFPKTANEAKKFDILSTYLDEVTDKFYNYSMGIKAKTGDDPEDAGEVGDPASSENWD